MQQIMGDDEGIPREDKMPSLFNSFDADPAEAEREERVRPMSGGEGDPQNERLKSNGGGEVASGSRDRLNNEPFNDDDDRRGMERRAPTANDGILRMEYRSERAAATAAAVDGETTRRANGERCGNESDGNEDESGREDPGEKYGSDAPSPAGRDQEAPVRAMAEVASDPELAEDLIPRDLGLKGGADHDGEGDDDEDPDSDEAEFQKLMEDTEAGMDDFDNEKTDNIVAFRITIPLTSNRNFRSIRYAGADHARDRPRDQFLNTEAETTDDAEYSGLDETAEKL